MKRTHRRARRVLTPVLALSALVAGAATVTATSPDGTTSAEATTPADSSVVVESTVSGDSTLPDTTLTGTTAPADTAPGTTPAATSEPAAESTAPVDTTVPPGATLSLTIAHINDHHSHLEASSGSADLGTSGGEFDYELGGFPRVVAKIAEIEAANDNVVKIHAGDAITGTLFYTLFGGEADAALMNQVCFDVFQVGNHEFDAGDGALVTFLDYLNADPGCDTVTLGANIVPAPGTPLLPAPPTQYLRPFHIVDFGDERVGFIGLDIAGKTTVSSSPLETTVFLDEVDTAQRYVEHLQAAGIENIVLVTHQQYLNDIALAEAVSGVDAIVGGDSHTLLGDFSAFGITGEGDYPTITTNADGDPVCVVQAWQYSAVVGELHLEFADGKLAGCSGTPHLLIGGEFSRDGEDGETVVIDGDELAEITAAIAAIPTVAIVDPDPAAQALLETFSAQTDELAAEVIGVATEPLCSNRLPGDSRSEGTCTSDQVAASGATADVNGGFIQQVVTDAFLARAFRADIALQNAGGVRIVVPAGEISIATAYEILPFSNTLVELELTGAEIVQTLEEGVANFVDNSDGSDGSYPYGSAIRWDADLSQPAGSRFSNVEVRDISGNWAPIDLAAAYVVVTNSFLASGGDGYVTFGAANADGRVVDTGIDYAQGFIDWLIEDADGEIVVPPPSEFSTQSFVPAG